MVALLALMSLGAQAQKDVFQKYQDAEGVTTIRIPKFLMRMASLGDKVSGLRVMTCERKDVALKIKADALTAYKRDGYEEMMRVKDGDEQVIIYHRPLKGNKNEYAILAMDDELALVNVTGNLSLEELNAINDMLD